MKFKSLAAVSLLVACLCAQSTVASATYSDHLPKGFWKPMLTLPPSVRAHFACIMKAESRSTFSALNLGDNNRNGSSGIFQIEQATFAAHQSAAGVPLKTTAGRTIHVYNASPYQQELVAIAIWRADGFSQWDRYDGC